MLAAMNVLTAFEARRRVQNSDAPELQLRGVISAAATGWPQNLRTSLHLRLSLNSFSSPVNCLSVRARQLIPATSGEPARQRQEGYTGQLPEHFPAGRTSKPKDYELRDVTSMWGRGRNHCATTLKGPLFFPFSRGRGALLKVLGGLGLNWIY